MYSMLNKYYVIIAQFIHAFNSFQQHKTYMQT